MRARQAEFFRLRWSSRVLDETEIAIGEILSGKGFNDAKARAERARASMEAAFEDAMVADFDNFLPVAAGLPDPNDHHVVAAGAKTQAAMIVTENLKDFPAAVRRIPLAQKLRRPFWQHDLDANSNSDIP
jgi:hypothetical protein